MEFNSDGSLKVQKYKTIETKDEDVELFEEETNSLSVLKLINELPFPLGRKLLAQVLKGDDDSKIKKLRLNFLENFGALDLFDYSDIYGLFDEMMFDGLIEIKKDKTSRYLPVVSLTKNGREELINPKKTKKEYKSNRAFDSVLEKKTKITDEDRMKFQALSGFLDGFNDEQKKAIIDTSPHILCIAGAGSGKTTVLTKRIEFLVKMKSINPDNILAVTFTRKARQEMISRLNELGINNVHIETFNSYCEKILQKYQHIAYDKEYIVMDFKRKIKLVTEALHKMQISPEKAVRDYFSSTHTKKKKDPRTLFFNFINDIFSLMDHYKNNEKNISFFRETIISNSNMKDRHIAFMVYNIIENISELKKKHGLRDYTDQILHTIRLFSQRPDIINNFSHILVDEYQDVNDIQVKLIDTISPQNLFVVGDPRQSIYGWRGSKIKNIFNFPQKFEDNCNVVQLTKNYRSSNHIVELGNQIIKPMNLPNLETGKNENSCDTTKDSMPILLRHKNENSEYLFVAQSILSQKCNRKEIFVIARTNKQLDSIAEVLEGHNIKYLLRNDETNNSSLQAKDNQVTLSTVHAIKGLEAEIVYMVGVNSKMYPCLVSEHPVQDLARIDYDYDKHDEELRLLYVAATRAKKQLIINYCGSLSKFITPKVKTKTSFVNNCLITKGGCSNTTDGELISRLKEWRLDTAKRLKLLPYMVFPDRVLEQLVAKKPDSVYELENISGIGPSKLERYGDDLLDIINN